MDNLEDQIEHLLTKSNNKQILLERFETYLSKSDKEMINKKIDDIIKEKGEQNYDDILNTTFEYLCENLPSSVDKKLYEDIVSFVNENIKEV